MAKNKFNQSWLHDHINDPYIELMQCEGYHTRVACKLKGIDGQDKFIKLGQVVVDLGATPGSRSQYIRNELAASPRTEGDRVSGTIVAIDILPMGATGDITFIQGDFREDDVFRQLEEIVLEVIGGGKVDLVLSDMAPNLSGVMSANTAHMEHIAELAVEFVMAHLRPEGALLIRCFYGSNYSRIVEMFRRHFKIMALRKPGTSRDKSSEIFLLGRQLKHPG